MTSKGEAVDEFKRVFLFCRPRMLLKTKVVMGWASPPRQSQENQLTNQSATVGQGSPCGFRLPYPATNKGGREWAVAKHSGG
jgi:hypothetical protein